MIAQSNAPATKTVSNTELTIPANAQHRTKSFEVDLPLA